MDKDREILQKIIDKEADEKEREEAAARMKTDPLFQEELAGLTNAVQMLRDHGPQEAPAMFTAEVMRKLPLKSKAPSLSERIREFLLAGRVLRWNMATAMAAAAVLILATVVAVPRFYRGTTMNGGPAESVVTVRLTFRAPQAQRVAVAGDFNKWRTNADEMKKVGGEWSIDLKLKPGEYSYSFIVDGKSWVPDPGAEMYRDDGYGSRNAVLRVNI